MACPLPRLIRIGLSLQLPYSLRLVRPSARENMVIDVKACAEGTRSNCVFWVDEFNLRGAPYLR